MSYKTLLVHVEPTPESDLRLRAAVALAGELGATLIGVGGCEAAYLDSAWIASDIDGMAVQALMDNDSAELKEAESRFHTLAAPLGSAALWRSDSDYPDRALQIFAAGADLIVSGAHRGPKAYTAATIDLVMQAGVPILTIPTDLPSIRTKSIVIAWKNTREARRAVSDALPLLKRAEQVTVLQVCKADQVGGWDGLDNVVGRLERHGVNAAAKTLQKPAGDPADTLIRFAEETLADLIVAGAYGHSRAREWALGGVTLGLIERSPLPVLFSR